MFPGSKEWKAVKSGLATGHSAFQQFGTLIISVVISTSWTIYTITRTMEYWLPCRHTSITVHTIALYPDFTLCEVEAALRLRKQRKRKEEISARLVNALASGKNIKLLPCTIYFCEHRKHSIPSIKQRSSWLCPANTSQAHCKNRERVPKGIVTATQEVRKDLKTIHYMYSLVATA